MSQEIFSLTMHATNTDMQIYTNMYCLVVEIHTANPHKWHLGEIANGTSMQIVSPRFLGTKV